MFMSPANKNRPYGQQLMGSIQIFPLEEKMLCSIISQACEAVVEKVSDTSALNAVAY